MQTETLFRLLYTMILLTTLLVSGYYRRKARQEGGTIARLEEGAVILFLRLALGLPILIALVAYPIAPRWLAWSSLDLPLWARWSGIGIGLLCVSMVRWVFTSIGKNVSETVLTKKEHQLVQHGPYRWVRHPLYGTALTEIMALGLVASSWLLLAMGAIAIVIFRWLVIPREEANLVAVFGAEYESYRMRTGALLPRIG